MTVASRRLGPVGAVPPPPVSVIRPHARDLKALTRLLAADHAVADALVFNPSAAENPERWGEARSASAGRGVAVIVDTLGPELTAPGTSDQYVPKAPCGATSGLAARSPRCFGSSTRPVALLRRGASRGPAPTPAGTSEGVASAADCQRLAASTPHGSKRQREVHSPVRDARERASRRAVASHR